jgi:diacylglycerol kinase
LALELFNSCIESLARAIDRQRNEQLRNALDIASGAVLVGAIGSAVVGLVILLPHVVQVLG